MLAPATSQQRRTAVPNHARAKMNHSIIATAVLALLAAACGASPASSNHGGSTSSPLLAFSRCMRSNGVPHFPDPDPSSSNEKFPTAQQLGVGNSQLQAAESA